MSVFHTLVYWKYGVIVINKIYFDKEIVIEVFSDKKISLKYKKNYFH